MRSEEEIIEVQVAKAPRRRRADGSYASRLSAELVVETALSLATREGGSALTVRNLGRELGADPAALYRFFRSKDDLILMLADHLLAQVSRGIPSDLSWQDLLTTRGTRVVAVFSKYAAVGAMVGSRTTRRRHEFAVVDELLGAMKSAGLTDEDAVLCYRTYADFIMAYAGTRAQYLLLDDDVRQADTDAWRDIYGELPRDHYPNIADLDEQLASLDDDDVLQTGLQMIVDGIALKAARTRQYSPPR